MQKASKISKAKTMPITISFALIFLLIVLGTVWFFNLSKLVILAYFTTSIMTFVAYKIDKNVAEKNKWRTPESTLNLLALCCGWPGALIAQHIFRHKTQKQPFKTILWTAIILNICAYSWFVYSFAA